MNMPQNTNQMYQNYNFANQVMPDPQIYQMLNMAPPMP